MDTIINPIVTDNNESLGHLLLRLRNINSFKDWLEYGGNCEIISSDNAETKYHKQTILHLLAVKSTAEVPDLVNLIKKVARKYPSLVTKKDGLEKTASILVLNSSSALSKSFGLTPIAAPTK